jgi:hypothetical protein
MKIINEKGPIEILAIRKEGTFPDINTHFTRDLVKPVNFLYTNKKKVLNTNQKKLDNFIVKIEK